MFTKLNAQELAYVLDPETLKQWVAFSLNKRCALIKGMFNKQITRVTLAKYYKWNRIRHVKPECTIYTDVVDKVQHQERHNFVEGLLEYNNRSVEIIYIDECTVNLWQKPGRVWIPKDHPFKVRLATGRGEGVTIMGAITSKRS